MTLQNMIKRTSYQKATSECIVCGKIFYIDGRGKKPIYCKDHKQRKLTREKRNYQNHLLEFFALAHLEADRIIAEWFRREASLV